MWFAKRGRVPFRGLDWAWVATNTDSINPYLLQDKTRVRYLHSLDYERVRQLQALSIDSALQPVYLDTMGPHHPDFDLLNPMFMAIVPGLVLEGRFAVIHLGPPCSSFSMAVNRLKSYAMRSLAFSPANTTHRSRKTKCTTRIFSAWKIYRNTDLALPMFKTADHDHLSPTKCYASELRTTYVSISLNSKSCILRVMGNI